MDPDKINKEDKKTKVEQTNNQSQQDVTINSFNAQVSMQENKKEQRITTDEAKDKVGTTQEQQPRTSANIGKDEAIKANKADKRIKMKGIKTKQQGEQEEEYSKKNCL